MGIMATQNRILGYFEQYSATYKVHLHLGKKKVLLQCIPVSAPSCSADAPGKLQCVLGLGARPSQGLHWPKWGGHQQTSRPSRDQLSKKKLGLFNKHCRSHMLCKRAMAYIRTVYQQKYAFTVKMYVCMYGWMYVCIVLCCIVSYCFVLYRVVSYCIAMYRNVCMYVCMYACICICICIYLYMYSSRPGDRIWTKNSSQIEYEKNKLR